MGKRVATHPSKIPSKHQMDDGLWDNLRPVILGLCNKNGWFLEDPELYYILYRIQVWHEKEVESILYYRDKLCRLDKDK